MRLRHLVAWLLLLLATATPVPMANAATTSQQASRLWRLAAQEQAMLDQRGVILKNSSLSRYLQSVVERLWKQVPSQLSKPTVKIIVDTRIKAHAYPNGVCFLSTGMLDVLENESQLALILAHEMVHYTQQHAAALYNHFQSASLQSESRTAEKGSSVGGMAMRQTIDAAERQADIEGLAIVQAAGYCDKDVLPLMVKLSCYMVEQGHPESVSQLNKRAERFKALVNQEGEKRTGSESEGTDANGYRDCVAPALIANAELALRGGQWSQAEISISKFLESEPLNARAYYIKGEILRRQNGSHHNAACISAYKKALEIDPTFQLTYRALGELYYKAGRYEMAKPYFEAFLNLAPRDAASSFIRGYLKQCQN
jgi:predicted Zn-dependent protease